MKTILPDMHARAVHPRASRLHAGHVANLTDFEAQARRALPRALHHYVAGASEDGATHRRNLQGFRDRAFLPQVLVDVSGRSMETSLFGVRYAAPFGIAPMGFSRLIAADGDVVLARAAAAAELPFVLSGASLTRMEEVRAAGPTSWFQAYIPGEDHRIMALLDRMEAAGFDTAVINVDTAVHGEHERAARHGFRSPVRLSADLAWQGLTRPGWLWRVLLRDGMAGMRLRFENMDATPGPAVMSATLIRDIGRRDALSWTHMEMIRRRWRGTLILKGVMAPADAATAKQAGIDGIIVSNHGGRQIDCAAGALDALEAIAAQGNSPTLMYDGGIRRGSDVLKALRLGAEFVFVGRPFLQAAAVGGESGVSHALKLLIEEVSRNMGLLGITRPCDVRTIALLRDGHTAR